MTKKSTKKSLIDDLSRESLEAPVGLKSKWKKEEPKLMKKIVKNVLLEYKKWLIKKIRKMTIPPKQKMEHTYCIAVKKYTGNSYIDSKQSIIK